MREQVLHRHHGLKATTDYVAASTSGIGAKARRVVVAPVGAASLQPLDPQTRESMLTKNEDIVYDQVSSNLQLPVCDAHLSADGD